MNNYTITFFTLPLLIHEKNAGFYANCEKISQLFSLSKSTRKQAGIQNETPDCFLVIFKFYYTSFTSVMICSEL